MAQCSRRGNSAYDDTDDSSGWGGGGHLAPGPVHVSHSLLVNNPLSRGIKNRKEEHAIPPFLYLDFIFFVWQVEDLPILAGGGGGGGGREAKSCGIKSDIFYLFFPLCPSWEYESEIEELKVLINLCLLLMLRLLKFMLIIHVIKSQIHLVRQSL
jgi:hypothetical protein